MNNIMPMSTTTRHNRLINTFIGEIYSLFKRKEAYVLQSDCALTYYGQRKEAQSVKLIELLKVSDTEMFLNSDIEYLEYIQPDFFMFKNNPYIENKSGLRIAGQPDLIIEIWSKSNTNDDRDFKLFLYSTSPVTEHWYIDQDSNSIECWIGSQQLPNQSLKNILKTQKGLEFDLCYLAI